MTLRWAGPMRRLTGNNLLPLTLLAAATAIAAANGYDIVSRTEFTDHNGRPLSEYNALQIQRISPSSEHDSVNHSAATASQE